MLRRRQPCVEASWSAVIFPIWSCPIIGGAREALQLAAGYPLIVSFYRGYW